MADDADEKDDALAFVSRNLGELGASLPQLLAKLRAAAAARGATLPPSLPDSDSGADRLALFVQYLSRFGRADDARPTPTPLRQVLDGVIALLRPELERHARVVETHATAPPVLATERQLAQIFLNLLVNAAQAIPEGRAQDNRIEVRLGSDERGWAVVDIEDSGGGIPAENLEKIFDPFFSTKRGAGKGLGLPITRQLVATLGGELAVTSEVGKGSHFRVALPPARQPAPTPEPAP